MDDYDGPALRAEAGIDLARGELNVLGLPEFGVILEKGCYGVYQPDATFTGGIAETWQIVKRVVAAGARYTPHTWTNGIGLAVNLQFHAASPCRDETRLEYPYEPPAWVPEARDAIRRLHEMGLEVAMLTGDSRAVAEAVDDRVFGFYVCITGVADGGIVHRGSDAEGLIHRQVFLPGDPGNLAIKILGVCGLEIIEEEKNPLPGAQMEIELQSVFEGSFGFDPGHGFAENRKPEVNDFLFQVRENPFGASHHQAVLTEEGLLHGLRFSANDILIHGKKRNFKFQNEN